MYPSSILTHKVVFVLYPQNLDTEYGRETAYEPGAQGSGVRMWTEWANVTFARGVKAMRQGTMDAYDSILIRCRYVEEVSRATLIRYEGSEYVIDSLHKDYQRNEMQITATEKNPE